MFWLVFRAYSRTNLPVDATRAFYKMIDFGIQPDINDIDQLLYVLCKRKHAQEFFDGVNNVFEPSVKTLIRGWGDVGEPANARKLFDEMLESGCSVDLLAHNSVLDSLCKIGNVDEAYDMLKELKNQGFKPDAYTYSIFIHAFCAANNINSAFRVLDKMKRWPDLYTYMIHYIIKKRVRCRKVGEAYQLLDEMVDRGVMPDVWCYNAILAFHCDNEEVNRAMNLMSRMSKHGCQFHRYTYNMVLKMLIRVGRFDRVEALWEGMGEKGFYPSVSTYAVMIHGFNM